MALERPGFDFASRDYENIRRDLLARAEITVPEWTDRDPSDFSMMLVDLWAYMGDILHYYVDRAAAESFVSTATQRESVLALANLFDYTPRNRTAATATVYVSNSSGSSVTLVAGTTFNASSESGLLQFYATSDTAVSAYGSNVAVPVREGRQIANEQLTTSASGQIGQRYSLSQTNVLPSSVSVSVYEDGVTPLVWSRVDDINVVASGVNAYGVYVNADGSTDVVFGNRLSGRVPPTGTTITASYSVTSGTQGNIGSNKITSFKSSAPVGLSITSSTASTGGTDGESVEALKTSIKALLKSQNRVVTLDDYVETARLVNGVEKVMASYTANVSGGGGGSVTVYALPYVESYEAALNSSASGVISVPAETQTNIVNKLQPLSMLGVSVVAASQIGYVAKTISASVTVEDAYVASAVSTLVQQALLGLYKLSSAQFGVDLNLGVVYKTIHSVPGVAYSTVSITGSAPTAIQVIRNNTINVTTSGGITTSV